MVPFEELDNIDGVDIYKTLQETWDVVSIQRQPTWREVRLVPIYDEHAPMGATIFIATLAYPNDAKKREAYVKAVTAFFIKSSAPPKSSQRTQLRRNPSTSWAIDIPNKRIQQKFSDCARRINKRFRAAWVLWQKLLSNPDPASQSPLGEFILKAAAQNTHAYPGFYSTQTDSEDQKEAISDSFRRQILYDARPVIHLAMALWCRFETGKQQDIDFNDVIQDAGQWFKQTLIAAEMFRVLFGDLFPRHDTQYKGKRPQNFSAPMSETIAILPYIDPIQSHMDYRWFLRSSDILPTNLLSD